MEKIKYIKIEQNINGEIFLPGSKSYTNRALILAVLSKGKSILHNYSPSKDSDLLIKALQALGVIIQKKESSLEIIGTQNNFSPFKGKIYIGAAGTTLRFLIPLCCLIGGEIQLHGTERMHERPISDLVNAMRQLGANIEYKSKEGCPPIIIRGFPKKIEQNVELNGSISSQFLSALLLTAASFPNGLQIKIIGKQISHSYIDMTCSYLEKFGIKHQNNDYKSYTISSQTSLAQNIIIEGDASGASYFLGIAALTKGKIQVHNIAKNSHQGDIAFSQLLAEMGCRVNQDSNSITVENTKQLKAISANMSLMPDTAQTLAVIATTAKGQTKINGLSTLKHKETNRCKATCAELSKLGIICHYDDNSMYIKGGTPKSGIKIETYDDHRMAMSFAMLGSLDGGIYIKDPKVVVKSFPNFWEKLHAIKGVVKK